MPLRLLLAGAHLRAVLLAALAVVAAAAPARAGEYRNERHGFRLTLPDGWIACTRDNPSVAFEQLALVPAADSRSIRRRLFEGNFYFFLAPAPEGAKARYRDNVTLSIASDGSFDPRAFDAQVAELLLPRLKADLPGYELLGHEVVPLGAGEAARIEGRFTLEGGARVRNVQLFIPRAERGRIILTGTSLEEDRAAFAAVFADIVASLDVPPPPPEPTEGAGLAGWALIAIALLLIPIAITGARRGGGDARARRRRR